MFPPELCSICKQSQKFSQSNLVMLLKLLLTLEIGTKRECHIYLALLSGSFVMPSSCLVLEFVNGKMLPSGRCLSKVSLTAAMLMYYQEL